MTFYMHTLVIFDVDGVLIDTDKGSTKDILVQLGKEKEVEGIHQEYLRRKDAGPWGLKELMALFEGYSYDEVMEVSRLYCASHLMLGASETVRELKKRSYEVGSITSSIDVITRVLQEMVPLDWIEGTKLEWNDGIGTGSMTRKIDRYTKRDILSDYMQRQSISKEDVIIIGDSITDVPIAECAGKVIAFNATDTPMLERADIRIVEKNLSQILEYV